MLDTIKFVLKLPSLLFSDFCGFHKSSRSVGSLAILTYHRVLPVGDARRHGEEAGMIVSPETLEKHIAWCQEYGEIVRLKDWLSDPMGYRDRRCFAFTFDDGWVDNYEFAFPVLSGYGVPATIFVVTDYIDTRKCFWPGLVVKWLKDPAREMDHANPVHMAIARQFPKLVSVPYATVNQASEVVAFLKNEFTDAELNEALAGSGETQDGDCLSNNQLQELYKSGLWDIGSHTATHCRLESRLDNATILDELDRAKNWLDTRFPDAPFCFPNGSLSDNALDAVRARHLSAVTTETGWNDRLTDPYLLKRFHLHDGNSRSRLVFGRTIARP